MIVDVEACCDIGCVRANNEDLVLVGGELVRDRRYETRSVLEGPGQRLLVALADGMGGAAAGEWASAFALGRLQSFLQEAPADLDGEELTELLGIWAGETHRDMLREGQLQPQRRGAGTTVVGLLLAAGAVLRFHAGDSRLYRFREGELTAMTQDHSLRQVTGDAALAANLLVNSLGGAEQSWLECAPLEGGLRDFDRFLLCSDGLHDLVPDDTIAAALAGPRSSAVSTLVRLARDAGGKDNISVALVDIGRIAAAAPPAFTLTA